MRESQNPAIRKLFSEGTFAIGKDSIAGHTIHVYRNAPASLRDVFLASERFAARPYSIHEGETETFETMRRKVAGLTQALADRGVRKGDRVAICMRNSPEWIVSFWACQMLGAVVVALNAWWTGPELAYAISDSEPRVIIVDGERLGRVAEQHAAIGAASLVVAHRGDETAFAEEFDDLAVTNAALQADVAITPEDPATILYTSGTTGRPKGALSTHRNHVTNLTNALLVGALNRLARGATAEATPPVGLLQTFPFFHIAGLTGIYLCAAVGGRMALMRKWDAPTAVRLIDDLELSNASCVPFVARQLLETAAAEGRQLASLTSFAAGGAPVAPDLMRRIGDQFARRASPRNSYGMTESTGSVICNLGADNIEHPDSVGRPFPCTDIRFVDENDDEVPPGQVGEIWIRTPQIIPGYWRRLEANAESFTDGWFRTGDVGYIGEEDLIYIVDRKKDVIIRGGENIYSAEVEAEIMAFPGVRDACVVGLPHPTLGEEVGALVLVTEADDSETFRDQLLAHLATRLARFKIPATLALTSTDFSRTATGKAIKASVLAHLTANEGGT